MPTLLSAVPRPFTPASVPALPGSAGKARSSPELRVPSHSGPTCCGVAPVPTNALVIVPAAGVPSGNLYFVPAASTRYLSWPGAVLCTYSDWVSVSLRASSVRPASRSASTKVAVCTPRPLPPGCWQTAQRLALPASSLEGSRSGAYWMPMMGPRGGLPASRTLSSTWITLNFEGSRRSRAEARFSTGCSRVWSLPPTFVVRTT